MSLTLAGLLLYQVLGSYSSWKVVFGFMLGAFMISGISWVDDLYSLPVGIRFAVHSLAAVIGIASFGYWHTVSFPLIGQIHLGLVGLPLTFFWIVGLTNAFNFGWDRWDAWPSNLRDFGAVFGWVYLTTFTGLVYVWPAAVWDFWSTIGPRLEFLWGMWAVPSWVILSPCCRSWPMIP
jgi:hypothetical protein